MKVKIELYKMIYYWALIISLLILLSDRAGAQVIFTENFTGDTYTDGWTIIHETVSEFEANNDRLEGNFSCCLYSGLSEYAGYQYYPDSLSSTTSDFDVRGYVWKQNTTGNRTVALGFWASTTKFVCVAVDNVYNDNKVSLQIKNGEAAGSYTYNLATALTPTTQTYYRITYSRTSGDINFYYWDSGWTQLGTTQNVDYGTTKFHPGTFHGLYNATAGGTTYSDSLWVSYLPDGSNFEITYPSDAGYYFHQDSTINITWEDHAINADSVNLYYTLDNGSNWILIATTLNDSSYSWTTPDSVYTESGRIKITDTDSIYADSSDNIFTILPDPKTYSLINILSVETLPYTTGQTLDITIRTIFIDELNLSYSLDSTNWITIENNVAIDTTNGFVSDTTIYQWVVPYQVNGTAYIRAREDRDTTQYFDQESPVYVGSRVVINQICYTVVGYSTDPTNVFYKSLPQINDFSIYPSRAFAIFDPSCGWNSRVAWRYYDINLIESTASDFIKYSYDYDLCEECERNCSCSSDGCYFENPLETKAYSILDTTTNISYSMTQSVGTSLVWNNRRYSLSEENGNYYILVQDLLNPAVKQIYCDYTSVVNTGGFSNTHLDSDQTNHVLQIFPIPPNTFMYLSDTIAAAGDYFEDACGNTIAVGGIGYQMYVGNPPIEDLYNQLTTQMGHSFGDYNRGYILIGDNNGYYNTYSVSALPEPQYTLNIAEDVYTITGKSKRNYFRGIIPKINPNY